MAKAESITSSTASTPKRKGGKRKSPYNLYVKTELPRVREANPEMPHNDMLKQVGINWKTAPENPKNQPQLAQP